MTLISTQSSCHHFVTSLELREGFQRPFIFRIMIKQRDKTLTWKLISALLLITSRMTRLDPTNG